MDRKMTIVIRDTNGNVINIGPWDDKGGVNPLPAGATQSDESVVTAPDGGLAVSADPTYVRTKSFRDDAGRIDLLTRLRTATPAQIDTWVENNVTTLAQARAVFKAIIKVIALDARQ
jgi:hypothetical protein